ncbi:MAG TPA: 5-formyltetrahydrofolate cyclo-ligase [Methanocorpusculum sp.]|nr:5-formyltetrahydrofolate cyclo-ligase [Methanocorpusculum sp.]
MNAKAELRLILKERRFALSPSERTLCSQRIAGILENLLSRRTSILFYASKEPEVETFALMERFLSAGKTVSVPIIEKKTHTLRLSQIFSLSELKLSTFNIPEPIGSEHPIAADEIETILLPMVGFDRCCHRLGYGSGYYDRFLATNPHLEKIGLAYSVQEEASIPVDEYDFPVDMVVTEKEIISIP